MNLDEKVNHAITTLKAFNKKDEPYYLCYSGGKDSDAVRILAELANVNFEVHNNHTTVDSPATVRYIKSIMEGYGERKDTYTEQGEHIWQYGDKGYIHLPRKTMWQLIVEKQMIE